MNSKAYDKIVTEAWVADKPSEVFKSWLRKGILSEVLPEIHGMVGIEQSDKHHQEGDVFNHTMMAIDVAAMVGAPLNVKFAVLFHDIGKTLTPKEEWPSHHNHCGERAVKLINTIGKRIRLPYHSHRLCIEVVRLHMHYHLVYKMSANTIAKIFRMLELNKCFDLFNAFVTAGICDELGRSPYIFNDKSGRWKELALKYVACKPIIMVKNPCQAVKNIMVQQQIEKFKEISGCK